MPIKAKTPQEILADFDEYFPKPEFKSDSDQLLADMLSAAHQKSYHDWLRSSMQSLLLHVMGEMPRRDGDMFPGISAVADGEELAMARQRGMEYGYDLAITDCLAVIQSTIDSIKE